MAWTELVLVGLMGTGKTTVGRCLADRLGWLFLDSDEMIEMRTGRTVREIWHEDGEAAFRRLESDVLRDALTHENAVVAAAGGVVLDPSNRELLRDEHVVWLRADPETLVSRASTGDHRPLLDDDPDAALRRMAADRSALYAEVADVVVDVDHVTADEVCARLLRELDA